MTTAAAVVLLLASIAVTAPVAAATTAESNTTRDLDGSWQSDGYGTTFVARGDTLRTYETTGISCLPGVTYNNESATRYDDEAGDAMTIKLIKNNSADLTPDGSAGHWTLHKRRQLPQRCQAAFDAAIRILGRSK
ncbi:MAG TPA: hypothetical protein VHX59_26985 [Mycobacteriales bacterium]|nr:hypothetical protein [Mycobacteriales bacterium]